ncbi:uncharacterized protein BYT42DRAFT_640927 [Radiomyces spectabilis]|uniref:uncharacterized protein n=1 Tax=Radiomyces spectabilis TaxID=64574 RepID=UPI00221E4568|nr:uncharacterized protein BYT42DRAFT_640927 [Radiomyces spectabilis]KAI8393803.1 hypothetical protein BYT42DRAFT_640927 [Radiomyces spectabilis]
MVAATLRLPEKAPKDIVLVYKYTGSTIPLETAKEMSLEIDGTKVDCPNSICKYLAGQAHHELLGSNKDEQAQVEEWLTYATSGLRTVAKKDVIAALEKKLDAHLSQNTFFVANRLTLVDLVIFGILHAYTKNMKVTACPNVMRWFDLIQNLVVREHKLTEDFSIVEMNLDDVPEPVIAAPAKKDDKKRGAATKEDAKAAPAKEAAKADVAAKGDKKDGKKKEKKEKKEKKPAAAPAPESDQPVVSRLDIRVGYIRNCRKHEGADSLYVEEIDLGDGEGVYRTIVSGLVRWYPLEEMQNRWVLCLTNLKPASMRGIKSEGMVLCATAPDGSKVELLAPVDTSKVKPGDRVFFEGMEGEPEKILPPKKKYWETVQPDFKTKDDCIACFGDKPFLIRTQSGETVQARAPTVQGGSIK